MSMASNDGLTAAAGCPASTLLGTLCGSIDSNAISTYFLIFGIADLKFSASSGYPAGEPRLYFPTWEIPNISYCHHISTVWNWTFVTRGHGRFWSMHFPCVIHWTVRVLTKVSNPFSCWRKGHPRCKLPSHVLVLGCFVATPWWHFVTGGVVYQNLFSTDICSSVYS